MNNFKRYNDYKLIYLITEGVEAALDILFKKYDILINAQALRIYPYGDKVYDLVQEGRMLFFTCLKHYNPDGAASFYTYFYVSLKRRYYKLTNGEYYKMPCLREDTQDLNYLGKNELAYYPDGSRFLSDELEILIYDECIMGGRSLRSFSKKYNYTYYKIYSLYNKIISRLKRSFTID